MTSSAQAASANTSDSDLILELEDLDLGHLPMETEIFARDPMPYFAAAREKHPWLAKSQFGLFLTNLTAMRDLLRRDDVMRAPFDGIVALMEAKDTPWGRFAESQMIAHSGASHKRLRDILAPKFTPRQANLHRPLMAEVIRELLDEWVPKGEIDFELFASQFPISVLCRLMGADASEVRKLRSSLEAMGQAFTMDITRMPAVQEGMETMDAFVQKMVSKRRANPVEKEVPDLLDLLMEVNQEGGLSDREFYDLLIFLFVAGYDTSKNVLTFTMHLLLDRPEIYERCAKDRDYCRKTVEEALRYFSPATSFRTPTEDVIYREVRIPAGTMIFFPLSISGRDPVDMEAPEAFNPERDRSGNRHVAFGMGMHLCLGQYIARAQIEEGLHLIAQRMKKPERAGPHDWRLFQSWGLKGLPIRFTPG